jgi:hypothetical protein
VDAPRLFTAPTALFIVVVTVEEMGEFIADFVKVFVAFTTLLNG